MKLRGLMLAGTLAAVLLSACTAVPDSEVDMAAVRQKLGVLDGYKATLRANGADDYNAAEATVRSFSFGVSKQLVKTMETLTPAGEYTDALDYSGGGLYGYDMLLTYWFNSFDQLGCVSYSMENDMYADTRSGLMAMLAGYGEPADAGYYDSADEAVAFDSEAEALAAVEEGGVYYYARIPQSNGIDIELYARRIDTGYDYWVYFTDYAYYGL